MAGSEFEQRADDQGRGPVVGVGALVLKDGRVLLIERGRSPGVGQWAIPGGKQRFGETLQQAAEREVFEETRISIKAGEPVYCFEAFFDATGRPWSPEMVGTSPRRHYVIVDLSATYISGETRAGDDARDARWCSPETADALPLLPATRRFLRRVGFLNSAPPDGDA